MRKFRHDSFIRSLCQNVRRHGHARTTDGKPSPTTNSRSKLHHLRQPIPMDNRFSSKVRYSKTRFPWTWMLHVLMLTHCNEYQYTKRSRIRLRLLHHTRNHRPDSSYKSTGFKLGEKRDEGDGGFLSTNGSCRRSCRWNCG